MTILERAVKEARSAGNVPLEAVIEARHAYAEKCIGIEHAIETKNITNKGLIKRKNAEIAHMREQIKLLDQWIEEVKDGSSTTCN